MLTPYGRPCMPIDQLVAIMDEIERTLSLRGAEAKVASTIRCFVHGMAFTDG
ncbi:MAG: hypothetical protein ACLUE1_05405 [Adlercreutzia equolifaciens]